MFIRRRCFLALLGVLPVIGARLLFSGNHRTVVLPESEFVVVRGWLLKKTDLLKD